MDEKLKMAPWATDEDKAEFVIFMVDRGRNKPNAFVWVYPDRDEEDSVWITTFGDVIGYFTQMASPMYFGDDRPKELMDAAVDVLNRLPENALDMLIDKFREKAYRREEASKNGGGQIEFEKECLDYFEKAGKVGDGLSAV